MATLFFNPNWKQINEAIKVGNYDYVYSELSDIFHLIKEKEKVHMEEVWVAKNKRHVIKLKALPAGTKLYYNGMDCPGFTFGDEFIKSKDKRTRVLLKRDGDKLTYDCTYSALQTEPCFHSKVELEKTTSQDASGSMISC